MSSIRAMPWPCGHRPRGRQAAVNIAAMSKATARGSFRLKSILIRLRMRSALPRRGDPLVQAFIGLLSPWQRVSLVTAFDICLK
jgi:hypothetical protein